MAELQRSRSPVLVHHVKEEEGNSQNLQIDWKFHVAYYPQDARMIEEYKGLLKQGLHATAATPTLGDWTKCLSTVLQTLNERSQRRDPAPVEAFLHWTAAPIQLRVQTKDSLLKPGMGKQGDNILLPAPEGLE